MKIHIMTITIACLVMASCMTSPDRIATRTRTITCTTNYWSSCREINERLAKQYHDMWLKEWRPSKVAAIYETAAHDLRDKGVDGVDTNIIDFVADVSRAYDTVGAVVRKEGNAEIYKLVGNTLIFVANIAVATYGPIGVVNPGGVPIAGPTESKKADDKITPIDKSLKESEKAVITHFRREYGVELAPW